jgi:hypothetical protein
MYRGILFTLLAILLACSTLAACGSKATFPDPILEAAIREAMYVINLTIDEFPLPILREKVEGMEDSEAVI